MSRVIPPISRSALQTLKSVLLYVPIWVITFALFLRIPVAYPLDERNESIVRRIDSLGGNVGFNSLKEEEKPEWLERNLAGMSTCQLVRSVFLRNATVPPEILGELKSFSDLEQLFIQNCQISDEGLAKIGALAGLVWLNLGNTNVTDTGARHFVGMTNLEVLILSDTQVTDAGLEQLKDLPNLKELYLGCTNITDEGLTHLSRFKDLKRIGLYNTKTTHEGRVQLRNSLPNCEIHPIEK